MGNEAETDYLAEDGSQKESLGQLVRANKLWRVEKRSRIMRLRRQGFTADQISATLAKGEDEPGAAPIEITPDGVVQAINRYVTALTETAKETAEAIRVIDNERLEQMYRRLELDAHDSDPKVRIAARRAQLKVLERHARMNGLDAPTRIEGQVDHHFVADPKHVAAVDASFAKRHGGEVIELPAGDVSEDGG